MQKVIPAMREKWPTSASKQSIPNLGGNFYL